ncbi:MAG: MBL fold metallo-hydrolase [Acidobacteria bacterium]|nr:MBL fold metallo-hydrolase [Acidobacteriota bacterium]
MARTVFGRPLHDVSAYEIEGLLVDTGCPSTAGALVGWAREHGVAQVVLTHHHEDHVGGASALRHQLGLPVLAPALALPRLARGASIPLYRRLVWGRPRAVAATALPEVLEHCGRRYRIHHTPGHAFDHVCLFDEERKWLLSGDLFVHERALFLRRIEDFDLHLESLRRMHALGPELLLCAHAGFVEDGAAALGRKIAFWAALGEEVRARGREGWSPREIRDRVLGREGLLTYVSFGDFSKLNLVRACLRSGTGEAVPASGDGVS